MVPTRLTLMLGFEDSIPLHSFCRKTKNLIIKHAFPHGTDGRTEGVTDGRMVSIQAVRYEAVVVHQALS